MIHEFGYIVNKPDFEANMPFQRAELGISGVAFAITPSDSTNLSTPARVLWVGNGGDLNVVPEFGDTSIIHRNVPTGWFIGAVKRVSATNTTATNIVGWV